MPCFHFGAASAHKDILPLIHVGLSMEIISAVSHHLWRAKQWPFSFHLAAGTLKCIKFPLGDLKSVFSPMVAE